MAKWKIYRRLDYENLWEITTKYNSNHRNYRYELIEEPKIQVNIIFIGEKLPITVIMVAEQYQLINLEQD